MIIDVRKAKQTVTEIKFAEPHRCVGNAAVSLKKGVIGVILKDKDGDTLGSVCTKEDAENLVKALQEASTQGWLI